MIIPTAARAPHVLRCIRRTALLTDYPDLEIIVALSATIENDWTQQEIVRALSRLPRVRVIDLALAGFNYAEAINRTAEQARGDYLLLLNDDVAPQEPDWLHRMATLLTAPVRIAGARLLYGNDMIQHGGVTMGLADLCEHSGRFWSPDDPGPAGIALLDRDVSAVTAACLLVENSLFRELGGLDTGFAIALNDVDFCLRAGKAGAGIAFCAGATLYHYESLSLGRHYEGDRAGLEATEVRALRERWPGIIVQDPFYNPQASRDPAMEWQPAFPPPSLMDRLSC